MRLFPMSQPPSILIVDDDASLCQAIARVLIAAGWRARQLASAEAVLESDAVAEAACLIVDIELPGMSGFDLQERLASAGPRRPVIFMTGSERAGTRERALGAGAVGYFTKPFSGRALIETIRQQLEAA